MPGLFVTDQPGSIMVATAAAVAADDLLGLETPGDF
jgi:hypothetical protein